MSNCATISRRERFAPFADQQAGSRAARSSCSWSKACAMTAAFSLRSTTGERKKRSTCGVGGERRDEGVQVAADGGRRRRLRSRVERSPSRSGARAFRSASGARPDRQLVDGLAPPAARWPSSFSCCAASSRARLSAFSMNSMRSWSRPAMRAALELAARVLDQARAFAPRVGDDRFAFVPGVGLGAGRDRQRVAVGSFDLGRGLRRLPRAADRAGARC